LLAGAVLRRRFHRYGRSGELLFVQAGWWRRQLWAVPIANVQSASISRSLLQRWLGSQRWRWTRPVRPLSAGRASSTSGRNSARAAGRHP
jgi:uncharacterized membrane protein YdbT with pleckstrin-like domain